MDKMNPGLTAKEKKYLQTDVWLYVEWEDMVKWAKKCNDSGEFVPIQDHSEELDEDYFVVSKLE